LGVPLFHADDPPSKKKKEGDGHLVRLGKKKEVPTKGDAFQERSAGKPSGKEGGGGSFFVKRGIEIFVQRREIEKRRKRLERKKEKRRKAQTGSSGGGGRVGESKASGRHGGPLAFQKKYLLIFLSKRRRQK